jgi:hypothetical protein
MCFILTDAYCKVPKDCASFAYLGEDACSNTCDISKAECKDPIPLFITNVESFPTEKRRCCKGLPVNTPCFSERRQFSLCAPGLVCDKTNNSFLLTCQIPVKNTSGVNWIIGVAIALGSSVVLNVGMNIQKYAFKEIEKMPLESRPAPFRNLVSLLVLMSGTVAQSLTIACLRCGSLGSPCSCSATLAILLR